MDWSHMDGVLKGPNLSNFPILMMPYQWDMCCGLRWVGGNSHRGLLRVKDNFIPYIRVTGMLERIESKLDSYVLEM